MTDCSCSSHGSFLTSKGLEQAAQRKLELLSIDSMDTRLYLDKVGSVSGLGRDGTHWPSDEEIDQQYRRFLNGS